MRQLKYALGVMYYRGQGVSRDSADAIGWYRKAADQGNATAQYVLGVIYYQGKEVPRDYAQAIHWYRKAADHGDEEGQMFLALAYYHGEGVSQSYADAARWFGKVVTSCFARCQEEPLQRVISVLVLLLALPILVVPRDRWGCANWLPSALLSAALAGALAHELLLSQSSLALLARVLPRTIFGGFGRILWLALLAGGSAIFAVAAVVGATRGSDGSGKQRRSPTPPEGNLENAT